MKKIYWLWMFILFSVIPKQSVAQNNYHNNVVPVSIATTNNVTPGWPASNVVDHNINTVYSSQLMPTSANSAGAYVTATTNMSSPSNIFYVILTPRLYNKAVTGFPAAYQIWVTAAYSSSTWILQGTYTIQPTASGVSDAPTAIIPIGPTSTFGVKIVPTVLGVDQNNNHYFQLAEIQLAGPSAAIPVACSTLNQGYSSAANSKVAGVSALATSFQCSGATGTTFPSVTRLMVNNKVRNSIAVRRFNSVGLQRLPPYMVPVAGTSNLPTNMPLTIKHGIVLQPSPLPPKCLPPRICTP